MRDGWQAKTWNDVLEIRSGRNQKEVLNPNGKYPIIGSAGKIMGYADKYICEEGTTIVGRKGTINNPLFIKEKFWNVDTAFGLHTKENINKHYLHYFCLGFDFSKMDRGSGRPSLVKSDLLKIKIPIPPLEEQKQIVALLDKAFATIDQAKANIEKNILNAKELLESYKTTLLEKYATDNFVEFESIVKLSRGHNPPKKDFIYEPKDGYVRFYQIRDGWSDKYKVYVPETTKLHRVQEDEMLMVAYRHIGKVFRGVNGAFNVALCKITNLNTEVLNNDYLFELIPSPFIKGELLKISERSLIPSMSVKELAKLKVPFPSMEKQLEIVKIFTSLNSDMAELIGKYEVKLNSIDELKKSMLKKAFAGELTKEFLVGGEQLAVDSKN